MDADLESSTDMEGVIGHGRRDGIRFRIWLWRYHRRWRRNLVPPENAALVAAINGRGLEPSVASWAGDADDVRRLLRCRPFVPAANRDVQIGSRLRIVIHLGDPPVPRDVLASLIKSTQARVLIAAADTDGFRGAFRSSWKKYLIFPLPVGGAELLRAALEHGCAYVLIGAGDPTRYLALREDVIREVIAAPVS